MAEGNTARRDQLMAIQAAAQARWAEAKVFECDAPAGGAPAPEGKFFGNFPYPYMNGVLHLGHAFSLSKLEFAAAFHRVCGKRVLFPQGFHCTGMPIKACADKLAYELATYGNPPVVPEETEPAPEEVPAGPTDPTKFKATKGKAAAKKGKGNTQYAILKSSGIPEDEIHSFQDPLHWLQYFPPLAKRDLTAMGCGIDWRRSFITTDVNPYYDSFVQWQLLTLFKQGKVVKDKRFAVYSPKDGQPCADHDRASGEGVGPQEYTLIKMEALELPGKLEALRGRGRVFFMAATLRPETMYGQTNCWVLPEGDYGVFAGLDGELYIMCERAARNLSFQDKMPTTGEPECLLRLKGQDLIGCPIRAPNLTHERIYVLPLLTILMSKGTGVVTSVPSDSPADFMALQDLKKKEKLREKYGVKDEWVLPFDVIPIIDIPGFGDKAAEKVCADLKIQSQNDTAKLEEAKGLVYLKGFTDGVMLVGGCAGMKVSEAKPLIRQQMLDAGEALVYAEPERAVMSRSGDDCVVALTDQWYIIYGEDEWRTATEGCLERMQTYDETVTNGFRHTLGWLNQWACSRSFGLGTKLPWDPVYLIESLSDSTIYMAYYTVAHVLQNGDMYGDGGGPVKPEHLTPEVWDAIFLDKEVPAGCPIPADAMARMRDEFNFWYPFDLRVSGKDLIQNHLTFCLYNHTAIWANRPDRWPQAMRCNGHLMLNSEKMSKSTGNFKTLKQAIEEYSADAMRVALADAGDSNDDANFEESVANAAVLRLTRELAWAEETLAAAAALRTGDLNLADRVFANAISVAAHSTKIAYEKMLMREAVKHGWYDLLSARDTYRLHLGTDGMHADVVRQFLTVSAVILAPICPHTCDHVYANLLKAGPCVLAAGWPQLPEPDFAMKRAAHFVEDLISKLRAAVQKKEAPPKKKKADAPPPPKVTGVTIYVADKFDGWRASVLAALKGMFDAEARSFPDDWAAATIAAVRGDAAFEGKNDKLVKAETMPFIKFKKLEAEEGGSSILEPTLPYDELAVVRDFLPHIKRSIGIDDITAESAAGPDVPEGVCDRSGPFPGEPRIVLATAAA